MSEYYNESPLQILVTKTRDLAQETPNSSRALGKALVTMMETFLDHAGWDHIDDAAARANGNFLAEYTTGVETPGNAGVGKAHSGRAARAARDGLNALRRRAWMDQFDKVAFIISTTGVAPKQGQHPAEYNWFKDVTRTLRGLPPRDRRLPMDQEQIGLLMGLGLTVRSHEEKWWTQLQGVLDFINKNRHFPRQRSGGEEHKIAQWCALPFCLICP
jgi:hypothetical protein